MCTRVRTVTRASARDKNLPPWLGFSPSVIPPLSASTKQPARTGSPFQSTDRRSDLQISLPHGLGKQVHSGSGAYHAASSASGVRRWLLRGSVICFAGCGEEQASDLLYHLRERVTTCHFDVPVVT